MNGCSATSHTPALTRLQAPQSQSHESRSHASVSAPEPLSREPLSRVCKRPRAALTKARESGSHTPTGDPLSRMHPPAFSAHF